MEILETFLENQTTQPISAFHFWLEDEDEDSFITWEEV